LKPIVVKDQVRLGPARCLQLSITGMYYRVTRSAITILILSLAVAFLAYVLFYGILSYDSEYRAYNELKEKRRLGEWTSRLSSADAQPDILAFALTGDAQKAAEYKRWGGFTDEEVTKFGAAVRRVKAYRDYFAGIPTTSRAILIADADPLSIVGKFGTRADIDAFAQRVGKLNLKLPLGSAERLAEFATTDHPFFAEACERIQRGQQAAIAAVDAVRGDTAAARLFAAASPAFLAALQAQGFGMSTDLFQKVSEEARQDMDMQSLGLLFANRDIGARLARQMNVSIDKLATPLLMKWMTTQSRAAFAADLAALEPGTRGLAAARLLMLSDEYRRAGNLQKVVGEKTPARRAGVFSMETRTMWLILVSFLVCLIGITNTMTMSITDRFSEIATMKCLGAMDSFVMLLFVFEAMLQGIVGSVIGVFLGLFLAFLRGMIGYGGLVFESIQLRDLAIISVLSFFTGIVIAGLAAMWPSWTASRLAPMEAMRVE